MLFAICSAEYSCKNTVSSKRVDKMAVLILQRRKHVLGNRFRGCFRRSKTELFSSSDNYDVQ